MHEEKDSHKVHHHRGKSSESLFNKEVILKELDISPGQTILDAGCGNGYMSKEIISLSAKKTVETGQFFYMQTFEKKE